MDGQDLAKYVQDSSHCVGVIPSDCTVPRTGPGVADIITDPLSGPG